MQDNTLQDDLTFEELPDAGLVHVVFDSLNDTINDVAGTEGLTTAQTYMQGILIGNGQLSQAERVSGAESFFSKVGDGVKKTIAYIVKMFKDIWGFFFKTKAPEEAKKTKKEIADTKADLKNPEKLKTGLMRVVKAAETTDEALVKEIDEASTLVDLTGLAKKAARMNKRNKASLTKRIGDLIEALKDEVKVTDQAEEEAKKTSHSAYVAFASSIKASVGGADTLLKQMEGVRDLEDLSAAEKVLTELATATTAMETSINSVAATESRVKGQIDVIEKTFAAGPPAADKKKEADEQLSALRMMIVSASKYSTALKRTMENIKMVNTAVGRVFGV